MLKKGWMMLIAMATPNCDRVSRLASESLERRLSLRERVLLNLHNSVCLLCRRYAGQLRALRGKLRAEGETLSDNLTLSMPADRKDRLKATMKGEMEKR